MAYLNGKQILSASGIVVQGGVSSLGGATGDITLGEGLAMENNELSLTGASGGFELIFSGNASVSGDGITLDIGEKRLFLIQKTSAQNPWLLGVRVENYIYCFNIRSQGSYLMQLAMGTLYFDSTNNRLKAYNTAGYKLPVLPINIPISGTASFQEIMGYSWGNVTNIYAI